MKKLLMLMFMGLSHVAYAQGGFMDSMLGASEGAASSMVDMAMAEAKSAATPCFMDSINWSAAAEKYVPGYTEYLSADEIKQLLSFYKSPLGQKSLEILPLLVGDSMAASSMLSKDALPPVVSGCLD